jgi:intergrase/recombinase
MGPNGVPDRYIDAFCGHMPISVLARHYADYDAETSRLIYEEAN